MAAFWVAERIFATMDDQDGQVYSRGMVFYPILSVEVLGSPADGQDLEDSGILLVGLDKISRGRGRLGDVAAIKTHNPFTVNDLYFAKEMGVDPDTINNYGSPLVFGHPQGPTAGRCVMELIEELALKGGGYGLFTGCAAGDTGSALVVKVDA